MSQYLFLFTIGPVQSFIAQARKTQDLYAGSKLLSDLTETAMTQLINRVQNCKFIFPDEDIQSKPNRFIAEIETDDVEKIGKDLENYVRSEFRKIAEDRLNSSGLTYEEEFSESFWKQIDDFLQIYWVALPLNGDYSEVYSKIERYLGAVKNVRVFKQLKETGRKCSICGERNALVYRLTDDEEKRGGLKLRSDGILNKMYVKEGEVEILRVNENKGNRKVTKIRKGEGLCAVCFTKRFYENTNFPSTAEISAMDWLQDIPGEEKNRYKKLFNNFDEELYYEENLREDYLRKYDHFKDKKMLDDAKEQLKELYKKYGKPKKYYALLMLDGDHMGRWLSGEFLADEEKNKLKDFHKKMSKELGNYAAKVDGEENENGIITDLNGKLVYAGGDDVLAFVNLEYLLDVMSDLRKAFPKFEELGFKVKSDRKSSASAGVVIAHYKIPLSEVLKWARKMEHEAKDKDKGGRDAFAIAVLKHSGEISKTVWKWDLDANGKSKKIELLKELVKELQDDKEGFSHTFIKNLNMEFMKLDEIEDKWVEAELKRLLERASQIKSDKEKKKERVGNWQEKLFSIYTDADKKDNFLYFLNIADFLARRTK